MYYKFQLYSINSACLVISMHVWYLLKERLLTCNIMCLYIHGNCPDSDASMPYNHAAYANVSGHNLFYTAFLFC